MKRAFVHASICLLLLFAALNWSGCYTVPVTGRTSLNFISPGEEMQLGATEFQEIKKKEKVSTDPEMNARVQRVGERIAKAVADDVPHAKWEFVVFDDDKTVNAFALPGGKVGVYSGLLKIANTDDELAIVMGHEIGHVAARHGAERMSQGLLMTVGGVALDVALHDKPSQTRNLALAAYGAGATVGVMLPFSRLDESEADHIGLVYAARAGYDPRAAITFWQKMEADAKGKKKLPEFLSTHPSDERRIERIKALLPEVMPIYEAHKRPPPGQTAH